MKLERLEDVDRAFVHVDYETQHAPEHKKVSVPSSAHTLPSTREHYNRTSPARRSLWGHWLRCIAGLADG